LVVRRPLADWATDGIPAARACDGSSHPVLRFLRWRGLKLTRTMSREWRHTRPPIAVSKLAVGGNPTWWVSRVSGRWDRPGRPAQQALKSNGRVLNRRQRGRNKRSAIGRIPSAIPGTREPGSGPPRAGLRAGRGERDVDRHGLPGRRREKTPDSGPPWARRQRGGTSPSASVYGRDPVVARRSRGRGRLEMPVQMPGGVIQGGTGQRPHGAARSPSVVGAVGLIVASTGMNADGFVL
jgi:hypothetical protein